MREVLNLMARRMATQTRAMGHVRTRLFVMAISLATAAWSTAILAASGFAREHAPQAVSSQSTASQVEPAAPGVAVAPRQGDICVVCNQPIGPDDRVYLIDGQRVAVHAAEDEVFRRNPDRYLAQVRPRGGLLGTEPDARAALSWHWLAFGAYVLLGLTFAGLSGYGAVNRGLRPVPWFFLGLAFNVFAYLALLTRPKREAAAVEELSRGLSKVHVTYAPEPCPHCGTPNHPSASACSGCGAKLEPRLTSEVAKAGLPS